MTALQKYRQYSSQDTGYCASVFFVAPRPPKRSAVRKTGRRNPARDGAGQPTGHPAAKIMQ